jgi:hypothetical protein
MIGYGEVCPLGPFYLPAYAEGVRAGLKELGPHLAHSTPEEFRFSSTVFNSYVSVSNASGAPQCVNGFMQAGTALGLGIEPRFEVLSPGVIDVC